MLGISKTNFQNMSQTPPAATIQPETNFPDNVFPVVLAGGFGRRLWPLSRESFPKPFLRLCRSRSLLQQTLLRLNGAKTAPCIIGHKQHEVLFDDAVGKLAPLQCDIILEPSSKKTAAAIALGAYHALQNKIPYVLVMPSDHEIRNCDALWQAVDRAIPAAKNGHIVTFGIRPQNPETRYGYVTAGSSIVPDVFDVKTFIEKPLQDKARMLLKEQNCFWNSGIFLYDPDVFLASLDKFVPDLSDLVRESAADVRKGGHKYYPQADYFNQITPVSVDYAVMEKADNIAVTPVALDWQDVGTWPSFIQAAFHALQR